MISFRLSRTPELYFGPGRVAELPAVLSRFGEGILFVTGRSSTAASVRKMIAVVNREHSIRPVVVAGEPSPALVDAAVSELRSARIHAVVAIGGGSVIDAGKAISAMLPHDHSVREHLEGIGSRPHSGLKVPFVAVPTTAGTGSEATKNAVLSEVGASGFKRSIRHENFVPDLAIIDPELLVSCPPAVSAACGMDAFTQLLEAYVSPAANPVTDALALDGMRLMAPSLVRTCTNAPDDVVARADVAYAAYLSGIVLANAGLGVVHGFASVLGGISPAPHGVICGTLVASATAMNIRAMRERDPGNPALEKYARAGELFGGGRDRLVDELNRWTAELSLPALSAYGLAPSDAPRVVALTEQKANPVKLTAEEMTEVLESRMLG